MAKDSKDYTSWGLDLLRDYKRQTKRLAIANIILGLALIISLIF